MLRYDGSVINAKRIRRIYRDLGLQLRNKIPKRRVNAKLRGDRKVATMLNETWARDFVHGQLATGRKLRILMVVHTYSIYSPAIDPLFTCEAEDVVRTSEEVCKREGYPTSTHVDQHSEFISRDLDLWAYAHNVVLDFSRPGKATVIAYIESFDGHFRAEWLNAHWLVTIDDAQQKLEDRRRYYSEERPNGAIGQKAPVTLINRAGATNPAACIDVENSS